MAKYITTRLSPHATMVQQGYGVVEPNKLSAPLTGDIISQVPADAAITLIENGMFLAWDFATDTWVLPTDENLLVTGFAETRLEPYLMFSEIKLFDTTQDNRDCAWAMKVEDYVDGKLYPRGFKVYLGDTFTTNTIVATTPGSSVDFAVGDYLAINADGYLEKYTGAIDDMTTMIFVVRKVYTVPDGKQPGLKLQRVR